VRANLATQCGKIANVKGGSGAEDAHGMENTLLIAGIASLLAAIVGGGLKFLQVEIPVVTWPRQLVLLVVGSGFCIAAFNLRPRPPPARPVPIAKHEVQVQHAQRGGPFVILSTLDKKYAPTGTIWHAMDVKIENHCTEAIHVDPATFRLYLATAASTEHAPSFAPELVGAYPGRLATGWLDPGRSSEGTLIFQVPDKLSNGADTNGAYHLVRVFSQSQCPYTYQPY
jgi:hypothetical protein